VLASTGETGRMLVEHVNMIKRHTKKNPASRSSRRHRGAEAPDRGFERDDLCGEVRPVRIGHRHVKAPGGKTRVRGSAASAGRRWTRKGVIIWQRD
jgi:hypothetical protein